MTDFAIRSLLFETGNADAPYLLWGTCFLAEFQGHWFVFAAYHQMGKGDTITWDNLMVLLANVPGGTAFGFDVTGTGKLKFVPEGVEGQEVEGEEDEVLDIAWARIRRSQIRDEDMAGTILFDLETCLSSKEFYEGMLVTVRGFPFDSKNGQYIDYDKQLISLRLHQAKGLVTTEHRISQCVAVRIAESSSDTYQGFSGSPVFIGDEANHRLAGMAVRGDFAVKLMHFIPAFLLRQLAEGVINRHPTEQYPDTKTRVTMDIPVFG